MLWLWALILSSIIIKMCKMKGHGIIDSILSPKRLFFSLLEFTFVNGTDLVSDAENVYTQQMK